jgi:asparagine synthase (glutamine-hydrolysing)
MALLAAVLSRQTAAEQTALVSAMLDFSGAFSGPSVLATAGCVTLGYRGDAMEPGQSAALFNDGELWIVLDGRLEWDRTEAVSGDEYRPASDAELVLRSYRHRGAAFLEHLYGDFALAIWDHRSRTLIAARDTFGVRPLYYAAGAYGLALASDPEQLLTLPFLSRAIDPDMVIDYLLWDPIRTDRSFFAGIRAVPGNHSISAQRGQTRIMRYASPALRVRIEPSRDSYYEAFRRAFELAVARSLAPGPVVAELSGGLDSSCIVSVADSLLRSTPALSVSVAAASARYPGLPTDEGEYIRAVAERLAIPARSWDATRGTVDELQEDRSLAVPGGRFATFGGTEGQLDVMREFGARVLVSGLGGDQVGSSSGAIRDAVTELRWGDAVRMIQGWPSQDRLATPKIIWALARSFAPVSFRRWRGRFRQRPPAWLSRWARSRVRPPADPIVATELPTEIGRRNWRSLQSGLHAMTMTYVNQYALRRGITFRYPFLDLDVVSRAMSIPARYWPPPWPFERLHRGILADVLPPEIVKRRSKATFDAALHARVRRHLPTIRELVVGGAEWACAQFVDRKAATHVLRSFEALESPGLATTYGLWAIATLEAWMRRILRYASPPT